MGRRYTQAKNGFLRVLKVRGPEHVFSFAQVSDTSIRFRPAYAPLYTFNLAFCHTADGRRRGLSRVLYAGDEKYG